VAFDIDEVITSWSAEAAIILLHAAQIEAPHDTGAFAATMLPMISVAGGTLTISIIATTAKPKAVWIQSGTMAHAIGTEGNFLFNPADGFAAMGPIMHPGHAPNQFGMRAIEAVRAELVLSLMTAVMASVAEVVAATHK
jgi:hypothetical protein